MISFLFFNITITFKLNVQNSLAFEEENNKLIQQMKRICEIMTKINNVELECSENLGEVFTPVEEKNIVLSFLTYIKEHSFK